MAGGAGDWYERERRWLVRRMPDPLPEGTPIRQGYVARDGEVSVRLRHRGDGFVATVKGGRGRRRVEVEWDLDAEQFQALWPLTDGRRLEKVRHLIDVPGGTAELDVFGGALDGLVMVEVEFDDDDAMAAFEAPAWFGPEVTDDGRYGNGSLAVHGMPPDHPEGFPEP